MSAYAAPIELVQAALHRCGEESLTSLDDDAASAQVVASNYEGIIRSQLKKHAWTFATQTVDLTYQSAVELGPWRHAYVYPASVINIRHLMCEGRILRAGEYTIESGRVLTVCEADYQAVTTYRVDEGDFSDDFAEAIVVRLQGFFLESLCDKWQDGRLKIKDSRDLLAEAMVSDKRQTPGVNNHQSPLAESWKWRGSRAKYRG